MVERMAASYEVIAFDALGTGLSDRARPTTTISQEVEILDEVLNAAGVGSQRRASLFCSSIAASTAIRYAARHPENIRSLVLFGATLKGADLGSLEARQALLRLIRAHWGLGSALLSDVFVPDLNPEDRRWFSIWQRGAADGDIAAGRLEMYYDSDVSSDAADLSTPALIIHRADDRAVRSDLGAAVAAAIPSASFQTVVGSSHLCFLGDWQEVCDLALAFLAETVTSLPRWTLWRVHSP